MPPQIFPHCAPHLSHEVHVIQLAVCPWGFYMSGTHMPTWYHWDFVALWVHLDTCIFDLTAISGEHKSLTYTHRIIAALRLPATFFFFTTKKFSIFWELFIGPIVVLSLCCICLPLKKYWCIFFSYLVKSQNNVFPKAETYMPIILTQILHLVV